ncbi:MAG: periplasmic copper-binding protein [Candidatus Magnetoglobus multicellularis str. Araruama]|uniref:Periplasmic copper-binding protein n=1 Tax=Candidatus Magnetoglobus multicellularis str. Araruama TaxID=890399 RepID=A0A1V1NYT1_9BACT|nr:MAG: periplasmic copper-binding protein [Candidatus Magnetoglobus multicellularis str. Araruama]
MTVVVRDGLYLENILVNKELTIISENGYTTCIIQSSNPDLDVVEIRHSNVKFEGFSILGSNNPSGIHIGNGIQYCQVISNKCGLNSEMKIGTGIKLSSATNNSLIGNKCLYSYDNGILLEYESNNNEIINNECTMNRYGIYVSDCHNVLFIKNICSTNNWHGLYMCDSDDNLFESNICSNNNSNGMQLVRVSNCTFLGNIVINNDEKGFSIVSSENNTIFFNSFSNNDKHEIFTDIYSKNTWYSSTMIYYTYKGEYSNLCYMGNYYADHDLNDDNADGITDKNYLITATGLKDKYPLSAETNDYTVESWYLQKDKQFVISQDSVEESNININRGVSIILPSNNAQYQQYSEPAFCSGLIRFSQILDKDTFFFLNLVF